jgi:hypothetical protein
MDMVKKLDLGNLSLTAPGQAYNAFRHGRCPFKLLVYNEKDFPLTVQLEKDAYHGARCECHRLGRSVATFKMDVTSLYPAMMGKHLYPTKPRLNEPLRCVTREELFDMMRDSYCIARVRVRMKKEALCHKVNGKLDFCVGEWEDVYHQAELELLRDRPDVGEIVEVIEVMPYEQAPVFEKYINEVWPLKLNATDPVIKQLAKLLLNALYGKFGQRKHKKTHTLKGKRYDQAKLVLDANDTDTWGPHLDDKGNRLYWVRHGDTILEGGEHTDELATDAMPRLCGAVTAYARTFMWKAMEVCGLENLAYMDTDSLICFWEGYQNLVKAGLVHPTELGLFKLEEEGDILVRGPKYYWFNGYRHIKGLGKEAYPESPTVWHDEHFITGVSRLDAKHRHAEGVVIEQVTKHLTWTYTRRKVLDDGTTEAISIFENPADNIK